MAGKEFSIADIAFIPWVNMCFVHPAAKDFPLKENMNVFNWINKMLERPAVIKGMKVPEAFPPEKQFEAFVAATIGLGDLHYNHLTEEFFEKGQNDSVPIIG